jgi:hypothetical protein
MRTLIASLALLLAAPAAAQAAPARTAAAAAPAFTIRAAGFQVYRVGPFRPRRDATIAAAVRAFGETSSRRSPGAGACTVRWSALRLKIIFANFGAPGNDPCGDDIGLAASFTARSGRFRTWRGLRVGAPVSRIRARHPNASRHRRTYWLKTGVSPYGDGGRVPVVRARVAGGRVTALMGYIGAAGD